MVSDKESNKFSPLLIAGLVSLVIAAANEKTRLIPVYFVLFSIVTVVHLTGFIVAGRLAGAQINQIQVFLGKSLAAIKWKRLLFNIGSLPIGGSVEFQGMDYEEDCREGFCHLPRTWRITIIVSGAFALLLMSCLALGPSKALNAFALGFVQIVRGALCPLTYGQLLLERLPKVYAEHGFIYTLGIIASKVSAANLLPIPTLNGGQAILDLLGVRASKDLYHWRLAGLTLSMGLFAGLLIAVGDFILKHL